jgi:hypothetical protein
MPTLGTINPCYYMSNTEIVLIPYTEIVAW